MARAKKKKAATRVAVRPKMTSEELAAAEDEAAPLSEFDEEVTTPLPDPQLRALEKMGESLKHWRPAREVLTKVRAVPTIFAQYDRGTRVGGHPIERFVVVHGPSGHGKTSFCHGLGLSFLKLGHVYGCVDAEYTTPEDWLDQLMDRFATHPGFLAKRPRTYEETVDGVRELVNAIAAARRAGDLSAGTSALIVVDSLRKLVPEDIWTKIAKTGASGDKGSVDGMGGRGAQIKAALNSAWLDELTPLLYHTTTAMIAIARESEDVNADANAKRYGADWKMQGGRAIEYDSSLVIRITRASWVRDGAGEDARVVGERHRLTIRKTKVSGKDDKNIICYFHTSNGVLVPPGFDRARDVLELALEYQIVQQQGGWLKWANSKWQGQSAAVRKLTERPDALAALEAQVRERFAPDEDLPTAGDEE